MTTWKELSNDEKAFRKSKEEFLEKLKDVTTLVRSAGPEEFKSYTDLKMEVEKIFDKISGK